MDIAVNYDAVRHEPSQIRLARVAVWLTAFTQILVIPGFFFPFVTTRNIFFRLCVELALALTLLGGLKRLREIQGRTDPILKWFCFFIIAQSLAALFGFSPWHSLFGDFERMGGVWAWLHLFLFYVLLRILMREGDWYVFFRIIVLVADLIVIWGASEFLPATMRNPQFQLLLSAGSSIGNQGLLGPYLLLSFALVWFLLGSEKNRAWKAFALISGLIVLIGIGGARNRSSQLGLLVGSTVTFGAWLFLHPQRGAFLRKFSVRALGIFFLLIGSAYFLSVAAPNIADQFWGRWHGFLTSPVDHIRTLEWKIGAEGFRDRPLFGYGPENHQIIVSHHFDPAIYSVAGGGVFDRTHNAWIELAATSGIVGLLAMVGIWVAALLTIRDGVRENALAAWESALFLGALTGYAVYLTFWFFDINSVMLWVVILAYLRSRIQGRIHVFADGSPREAGTPDRPRRLKPTWAIVALIVLAGYLHGIIPLVAAHDLSRAASGGAFEDRLNRFERVMNSATPQTLHTFPLYYSFLRSSSRFANAPDANPFFRKQFDLALQRGMIEADRFIERNSDDDRSYVDAARFSMLAAGFYSDSRYIVLAKNELIRAAHISPRRPDVRILLSTAYLTLRDSTKAVSQLDSAMSLAPEYGASFFFAARLESAKNEPDSAAALLMTALRRKFVGTERDYLSVVSSLQSREEYLKAARLAQTFLEEKYGTFAGWKRKNSQQRIALTPLSDSLANQLPILYLKAGENAAAINAAKAYGEANPHAEAVATLFATDVKSGNTSKWIKQSVLEESVSNPGTT